MNEQETKDTTAGAPETKSTATKTPDTQSTAEKVDIDAITKQAEEKATAAAEKKMEVVFRSMLEQNGVDADTVAKMTTEWKSKQQTPEDTIKDLNEKQKLWRCFRDF